MIQFSLIAIALGISALLWVSYLLFERHRWHKQGFVGVQNNLRKIYVLYMLATAAGPVGLAYHYLGAIRFDQLSVWFAWAASALFGVFLLSFILRK